MPLNQRSRRSAKKSRSHIPSKFLAIQLSILLLQFKLISRGDKQRGSWIIINEPWHGSKTQLQSYSWVGTSFNYRDKMTFINSCSQPIVLCPTPYYLQINHRNYPIHSPFLRARSVQRCRASNCGPLSRGRGAAATHRHRKIPVCRDRPK